MNSLRFQNHLPFQAMNAGLFISPGHGIHPARVMDSHELIFVRSGHLHLEENGQPFDLGPNQTLLLWPGRPHRGLKTYEKGLSFYWIHFRIRSPQGNALAVAQFAQCRRPERIAELFHRFLDDQESGDALPEQADLILAEMFIELTRTSLSSIPTVNSLAARTERYIALHFSRGLSAGGVARAMKCNADYLGRIYRRAYERTLSQAIHQRQLVEGRHLLRESLMNIEEISAACGFGEARYFRKLFCLKQGMSPRAYRKLYARMHVNFR